MSDIFREVEEDVRRERLEKWWKKYGDYVIAGVSVVAIVIGGYKLWQYYEQKQRLKASSEFQSAMQLAEAGEAQQAAQAFARIEGGAPGGYALVAQMSKADALLAQGHRNEAIAIYMEVAKSKHEGLGDLALARAAWAQADVISTDDLKKLLAPLTQSASPWHFMAGEILAYRDFHDGLTDKARQEFESLAAAADAPDTLRQRAKAMATFIRTSGGRDYGTVPKPPEPNAQKGKTGP